MKNSLALIVTLALFSSIANATISKKSIEYSQDGTKFEGYYAYDDKQAGARPAILVAHDWMGLTDKTNAVVDRLAELGYAAFAVDVYGKGVRPQSPDEAGKLAGKFKSDRKLLRARMQAGLKAMLAQSQVDRAKTIVSGYCFGGTAAIELARTGADLKGAISFHGGLDSPTPADGRNIKAKILAMHGADDPFVPAADLQAFENEMRSNGVDWQLIKYGGAVHSFTDKSAGTDNSKGAAYNPAADSRSWQAMQDFLKEILR